MSNPFFSVLIPTRNRPELLERCLVAVASQEHASTEVLVLDQSEGEASRRVVETVAASAPGIAYHRSARTGKSKALNDALPATRGDWVVLTDDDCVASAGWLRDLEREARAAGPRAVVVGRVVPGPVEPGKAYPPATLEDSEPAEYAGRICRDLVYPNFAMPRAVHEEVGPFDERLGPGTPFPSEDNDFGYRLLRAGWSILYRPSPTVAHLAWRTPAERAALKRSYGLGQGAFYAKHIAALDAFIAYRFCRDAIATARAVAGAAIRGRGAESRGHLLFLAGLFAGSARMAGTMLRGTPEAGSP